MRRLLHTIVGIGLVLAAPAAMAEPPARIVAVGGDVTEIVYALGEQARLVGVDVTSQYPKDTERLPKVGYMRALGAEGVLSLGPTMVLATKDSGPPAVLDQIRQAGVPVIVLPAEESAAGVTAKIRAVGAALEVVDKSERLARSIEADFARVLAAVNAVRDRTKVLFVLSIGRGAPLAAGSESSAEQIIQLAGGVNAVRGFEGYKPVTAEAVTEAAPAVVLAVDRTLELLGGADALLASPLLAGTPAARDRRLVTMDGLFLLGFGPRTPAAVRELAMALYPNLDIPPLDVAAASGTANPLR